RSYGDWSSDVCSSDLHVGVTLHGEPERSQSIGQTRGVAVIDCQALDVVLERVQSGGGEHTGLAHRAAEDLARAPRTRDELAAANEQRSRRRAETLREAARHGIEARAERFHAGAEMDRGVEDSRAIEMRGEAAAPGERERLFQVVAADRPAADGVLQREQTRAREMWIVGVDRRLDLRKLERAVGAVRQRARAAGCDDGDGGRLV